MAATSTELSLIIRAKNRASGELNRASKDLKKMNKQVKLGQKALAGFKKVGTAAALGVGVAVGGFVAKSIADFASFDDRMTQSLAIMGDAAQEWRGEMETAAREVGKTTTFSATQAAEAYFFLASAGFNAQQSIAAMPQVALFAQAGMFDLATATDLATDAQSALGMKSDDAAENLTQLTRVTDVLVKANTLANATVEQFATSLTNKAGAALKVVGKDIEEGVAVLAAFADQGVKGAQAGTALNIVFREMQTKAIKNKDAFKEMGVAVFDAQGEMRNMADIVGDLEGLLAGMSDEQKKATLAQLGFSDKSVIFIQTLLGTSDAIRGYEEKLRSAGGMTKEVADKQLTSITSQFKLLMSQVQDAGIELGSVLVPALLKFAKDVVPKIVRGIKSFVEGLQKVGKWFADLSPAMQKVIKIMGLVVIAMAAMYANPVLAGLALIAVLIGRIGSQAAAAKGSAEAMLSDLEQLGTVSFENLEEAFGPDVVRNMVDAGISVELMTKAFTGNAKESFEATNKINGLLQANDNLKGSSEDIIGTIWRVSQAVQAERDSTERTNDAVSRAAELKARHTDQFRKNLLAANDLTPALFDLTSQTSDLNDDTAIAVGLTKDLASALLAQADPVFGAIDSYQNLQQVLKDIDEDGQRTSDELLTLAKATLETQGAFNSLSSENVQDAVDALSLSLGITDKEARDLLISLGLLDGINVIANATVNFNSVGNVNPGSTAFDSLIGGGFRADGGPVKRGESYIVGEEGEELFTPNQSGFIHPAGSFDPSGPGTSLGSNNGGGDTYIVLEGVDLSEGSRKVLMKIREGIRQLDRETL